jgi:hypothetical protein
MCSNLLNAIKQFNKTQWLYTILVSIAVVILTFFITQSIYTRLNKKTYVSHNFFFKNLQQNNTIDQIKKIKINYQQEDFTIVLDDRNNWVVLEKANYPVLTSKIKELVFGLADLKIIEKKTAQKENFSLLQLEDVTNNKNATQVTLLDSNNQELGSIYIGKREFIATPNAEYNSHIFVRRSSEEQAWLVSGRLAESFAFKDLVRQPLLDINIANILEISLTKLKEAKNSIYIKKDPLLSEYKLLNIPSKYQLREDYLLDNLVQQVAYLNYEDIIPDTADAVPVLEGKVTYTVNIPKMVEPQAILEPKVDNNLAVAENSDDLPTPIMQNQNANDAEISKQPAELNFELVYLQEGYYLRVTNKLEENNWLYKLSDYAYQSLLISKRDLISEKVAKK